MGLCLWPKEHGRRNKVDGTRSGRPFTIRAEEATLYGSYRYQELPAPYSDAKDHYSVLLAMVCGVAVGLVGGKLLSRNVVSVCSSCCAVVLGVAADWVVHAAWRETLPSSSNFRCHQKKSTSDSSNPSLHSCTSATRRESIFGQHCHGDSPLEARKTEGRKER